MVLPQFLTYTFALITLVFGILFAYYDIKSRTAGYKLFWSMVGFSIIEYVAVGLFQISIMLIIPIILVFIATLISYYTGNIGLGDLPIIASVLVFLFDIGNVVSNLVVFSVSFMLTLLLLPFVLYRKVLSKAEKAVAYLSVVAIVVLFLINNMIGLFSFVIGAILLAYLVLSNKDKMYEHALKYLTKKDLVVGDLIENKFLDQETRMKLGIDKKDGLTNINAEILNKIDDNMKLPIYSNSIPFTIPLLVGFICVFLAMI